MHDQVCKSGYPTTKKLHNLATRACFKRFKQKGRHIGSRGRVPTNKRNNPPARILPAKVIDYYHLGKRNRRSVSFLDESNSQLFELERTTG